MHFLYEEWHMAKFPLGNNWIYWSLLKRQAKKGFSNPLICTQQTYSTTRSGSVLVHDSVTKSCPWGWSLYFPFRSSRTFMHWKHNAYRSFLRGVWDNFALMFLSTENSGENWLIRLSHMLKRSVLCSFR